MKWIQPMLLVAVGALCGCTSDTAADDGRLVATPSSIDAIVGDVVGVEFLLENGYHGFLFVEEIPPGVIASPSKADIDDSPVVLSFRCDEESSGGVIHALAGEGGEGNGHAAQVAIDCAPESVVASPETTSRTVGETFSLTVDTVVGGRDRGVCRIPSKSFFTDLPPQIELLEHSTGFDLQCGATRTEFTFRCDDLVSLTELVVGFEEREGVPVEDTVLIECVSGTCGNSVADNGEECDGADLNGETCETLNFESGDLRCDLDCFFDVSGCSGQPICGDFIVEGNEECDDGNIEDDDGCDSMCRFECGNSQVDGIEQCDDGNRADGDGCDSMCQTEAECGNELIESPEDCDGTNLNDEDCATAGFGSGTLDCNSRCEFDFSGCTMPSEGCMFDLGFTVYETACAVSEVPGGSFFCSYTNDNFQNEVVTVDRMCNGTRVVVNDSSDRAGIATDDSGGGQLLQRRTSAMAGIQSFNQVGTLGPEMTLGVGSGPFLDIAHIGAPADGFFAFTAPTGAPVPLTVSTLGPDGAYIASFLGPTLGGAFVSESFAHGTGTELHGAVVVGDVFAAPFVASINGVVINRATSTSTPHSYEIAQWPDNSMPTLWDTLQHDDGDLQVWSQPSGSNVLTVVDVSSGTLAPTAVGSVTTMNGTLTRFRIVRVPNNSNWLVGAVDDGVATTINAYRLENPPAGVLDLSDGTELSAGGSVAEAAAGPGALITLTRGGELHFLPVP